jgi:hypothetical protein
MKSKENICPNCGRKKGTVQAQQHRLATTLPHSNVPAQPQPSQRVSFRPAALAGGNNPAPQGRNNASSGKTVSAGILYLIIAIFAVLVIAFVLYSLARVSSSAWVEAQIPDESVVASIYKERTMPVSTFTTPD